MHWANYCNKHKLDIEQFNLYAHLYQQVYCSCRMFLQNTCLYFVSNYNLINIPCKIELTMQAAAIYHNSIASSNQAITNIVNQHSSSSSSFISVMLNWKVETVLRSWPISQLWYHWIMMFLNLNLILLPNPWQTNITYVYS